MSENKYQVRVRSMIYCTPLNSQSYNLVGVIRRGVHFHPLVFRYGGAKLVLRFPKSQGV
jgi:hypothetical protein